MACRPRPLLLGVSALAGFAGQLYFKQSSLVFRPRPIPCVSPADVRLAHHDVWLPIARGVKVHGWWVPNNQARNRVVLFFNGSDGNLGYELSTLRFLHSLGTSVLMIDYPGYGRSDGHPHERGCRGGLEFSHRHETRSGVRRHRVRAVKLFPYLPVRLFCRTRMNSLARTAHVRAPSLFVHSTEDEHIPIAQPLSVFERARSSKRLVRLRGSHASTRWQAEPEVLAAWHVLIDDRTETWEGPRTLTTHWRTLTAGAGRREA